jgi:hypothetical protein
MDHGRTTPIVVLSEVRWFGGVLDSIRLRDREVLDPAFVAALDAFCETASMLSDRILV